MRWSDTNKNKLRRENERLVAELAETQAALAKLRDEYRWLCGYPGDKAMAVCEAAVAAKIAWNAKQRVSKMRVEMEGVAFSFDFAMHLLGMAEATARQAHEAAIAEYRAQVQRYDLAPEKLRELVGEYRALTQPQEKETNRDAKAD